MKKFDFRPTLWLWLLAPYFSGALLATPLPYYDSSHAMIEKDADLAWLLNSETPIPFAVWPRLRTAWVDLPATPALDHAKNSLPKLHKLTPSFSAWGNLALRSSSYTQTTGNQVFEAKEAGNGYDFEGSCGDGIAFWSHLRDMGLSGDTYLVDETIFTEDASWLYQERPADGDLTHDESRGGVAFGKRLPKGGLLHLGFVRAPFRMGAISERAALGGSNVPPCTQLLLDADWGALRFRQTLCELSSMEADSLAMQHELDGRFKPAYREKWLSSHRLEWNTPALALGLSELVVIGDRRPGLGYLLPTQLLWSEQHAQLDRDNGLMMADLRLRLPTGFLGRWALSAQLVVDDYSLSDWGEELEGQKTATDLTLAGYPFPYKDGQMLVGGLRLPGLLSLGLGQSRTRPYFGTHFYAASRLTHGHAPLFAHRNPNTRSTDWNLHYTWRHSCDLHLGHLHSRPALQVSLKGSHLVHGANLKREVFQEVNVGGDLYLAHRAGIDVQAAPFLAGELEKENWRQIDFVLHFPVHYKAAIFLGNLKFHFQQILLTEEGSDGVVESDRSSLHMSWETLF
jgi:hypothetical protein